MISIHDLAWFAVIAVVVTHWWQSRHAKSLALFHAARRCRELELQLLDQSVVLTRIRLQRGEHGLPQWRRHYEFEFSSTGQERYKGSLVLLGHRLLSLELAVHVA